MCVDFLYLNAIPTGLRVKNGYNFRGRVLRIEAETKQEADLYGIHP